MSGLATRLDAAAVARQDGPKLTAEQQISQGIQQRLKRIEAVMPGEHVDAKRMAASVMVQIERVPKLALCSVESIVGACLEVARADLELGSVSGEAWLVPYGKVCTFVLGYKGILRLARRSPEVESVVGRPVFANDHFDYSYEPDLLEHKPAAGERGELTHAYCRWTYRGGGRDFVVIDRPEIERRRHRGQDGPAWKTDYPAMAAKSAIRAAAGAYGLPLTIEAERALHAEGATITMQERPDGVLAVIEHEEPAALDPPRPVDAATGEVTRDDPAHGGPTSGDEPTDPVPEKESQYDLEPIGSEAGQKVHAALGSKPFALPGPLHAAVVARATEGRTCHASELLPHQQPAVMRAAKDAAAEPAGFAEAVLASWTVDTPERAALMAWLESTQS